MVDVVTELLCLPVYVLKYSLPLIKCGYKVSTNELALIQIYKYILLYKQSTISNEPEF